MKTMKIALLAAAAAVSTAGTASAQVTVWGAGSSLIAPYARTIGDCLGTKTYAFANSTAVARVLTDYARTSPTPGFNCSTNPQTYTVGIPRDPVGTTSVLTNNTYYYISTGSGAGVNSMVTRASTFGTTQPTTNELGGSITLPANPTSISFALSENPLSATNLSAQNPAATITYAANGSVVAAGTPGSVAQNVGPLIQFPVLVAPIAIVYSPIYKKIADANGTVTNYRLNVARPRSDGSGGLRLNAITYCAIFNGQITDWSHPALAALNTNAAGTVVSLRDTHDPVSQATWDAGGTAPLQIVGRSDSSGTTTVFTRHLANVCGAANGQTIPGTTTTLVDNFSTDPRNTVAGVTTPAGQSTLPAALRVSGEVLLTQTGAQNHADVLGRFATGPGSESVANYVSFNEVPAAGATLNGGRIGYAGADYALPATNINQFNTNNYHAASADVFNGNTSLFVSPTAANASSAFGAQTPPHAFQPISATNPTENRARANPLNWVASTAASEAIANPARGYPIVGTTNAVLYTCYPDNVRRALASRDGGLFPFILGQLNDAPLNTAPNTTTNVASANVAAVRTIVSSSSNNATTGGVIARAGLAPIPASWATAINQTFFVPNGVDYRAPVAAQYALVPTNFTVGGNTVTINTRGAQTVTAVSRRAASLGKALNVWISNGNLSTGTGTTTSSGTTAEAGNTVNDNSQTGQSVLTAAVTSQNPSTANPTGRSYVNAFYTYPTAVPAPCSAPIQN